MPACRGQHARIPAAAATNHSEHSRLLAEEADAAYEEYVDAWTRENHAQAESGHPEPEGEIEPG